MGYYEQYMAHRRGERSMILSLVVILWAMVMTVALPITWVAYERIPETVMAGVAVTVGSVVVAWALGYWAE